MLIHANNLSSFFNKKGRKQLVRVATNDKYFYVNLITLMLVQNTQNIPNSADFTTSENSQKVCVVVQKNYPMSCMNPKTGKNP